MKFKLNVRKIALNKLDNKLMNVLLSLISRCTIQKVKRFQKCPWDVLNFSSKYLQIINLVSFFLNKNWLYLLSSDFFSKILDLYFFKAGQVVEIFCFNTMHFLQNMCFKPFFYQKLLLITAYFNYKPLESSQYLAIFIIKLIRSAVLMIYVI